MATRWPIGVEETINMATPTSCAVIGNNGTVLITRW